MLRISSMPIDIEKSSTRKQPLRRGIHITEQKDYRVNPEPLVLQEADFLLEEFLSPTKLRALTGTDDLANIRELEMIVDTSDTSLGNFGVYLQKLVQLKLSNSVIPRVRDLGTSLSHVRILWMARCCLNDLDGITSLQSLEELYVAYNEIADLSALSMLENLRLLDLESNLIDDIHQVEFLALCPNLTTLTLEGNPINNQSNYRTDIIHRLPRLRTLDDMATNRSNKLSSSSSSISGEGTMLFQQDWSLIEECIAAGMAPADEKLACNQVDSRPRSANRSPLNRPTTAAYYRPRSAARPGSTGSIRPPSASMRPYTDPSKSELLDNNEDVVSELTIGPAFQGNLTKILRARKQQQQQQQSRMSDTSPVKTSEKTKETVSTSASSTLTSSSMSNHPLMKEIDEWRAEHNRKIEERKKLLEPQVLRITDDDDLLENDLEVDDSDEDNDYVQRSDHFQQEETIVSPSHRRNFGFDESFPSEEQRWRTSAMSTYSPEKSESRLTTGDTGYRSNSAASLHHSQSRTNSRSSTGENSNSAADRMRAPMRVNHEPELPSSKASRAPLSIPTGSQSTTMKPPNSPVKKSLKDFRNDPLPTLPRLPPRKT
ncbi:hypothetical protein I4U23_030649 [Adineta vaga]|nr:hypothetical protein I4U23_030649 [Adineta vaga]